MLFGKEAPSSPAVYQTNSLGSDKIGVTTVWGGGETTKW